jgi:photosystem II stability/assembly factor-like uncharacterized protein
MNWKFTNQSPLHIILSAIIFFLLVNVCSAQWIVQPSGTNVNFYDLFYTDLNTGFVVGAGGKIYKTTNDGLNWVNIPIVQTSSLWAINFPNNLTGYATGEGGTIIKTTNSGQNWVAQTPSIVENFWGIFFSNVSTGYISGGAGTIMRTTNGGTNWFTLTSGTTVSLNDITFANPDTGICIGHLGTILKTSNSGINWIPVSSGVTSHLFGVWFKNSSISFAVGDNGVILKTTNSGQNWVIKTSGTTSRLYDIYLINALTGIAVGSGNTIRRTTNGGENWLSQQVSIPNQELFGISLQTADTAVISASNGYILHTTNGGFTPPAIPNLTAPPNGAINVSITPLLDWDSASLAANYNIQIANDSSFTNIVIDSNGVVLTHLQVPPGTLFNNFLYYWRVRGFNLGGYGQWSQTWHFTTIVAIPNAPVLLLPPDNSANVPLNPSFDWDSTSPVSYYRLQLSGDSVFNTIDVDITGITSSQLALTTDTLLNNSRYYWRVNATNFAGTGNWSNFFRFTTEISIPAPPQLFLPPDGAVNVSLTPLLLWREDISATGYEVQIAKNSNFSILTIDTIGLANNFYTVPNDTLQNFTLYYWRVRTTNSLGTGNWSVVWHFTTILSIPAAPVLLSPLNNSTNVPLIPLLDWDDNAYSTYRVQLSADSTFATTLINIGPLSASQYQIQGGTLNNNTTYYWRVNATNTSGTGPWSAVWHFTTIVSAPVAPPILLSPPNGSTGISGTPFLNWNDVFGATYYRIQISTDSLFAATNFDSTLNFSQINIPQGILVSNATYYWRVRAGNIGGISPWSNIWHFTTGVIGLNIISWAVPKEFKLYHNFPNPFNPITKMKFDIPKSTYAKLVIYDLLGREVALLFDTYVLPGTYEVQWNASSHASGIYLYRLVTDDRSDIKKMVLVK